jgi:hypothetical protein
MAVMKRVTSFFCCIVLGTILAHAQQFSLENNQVFDLQSENILYNGSSFPSIKPALFSDILKADTLHSLAESNVPFSKTFQNYNKPLLSVGNKFQFLARIEPNFEASSGDNLKKGVLSHSSIGVSTLLGYKNTLLSASLQTGFRRPYEYERFYTDSFHILPSLGMVSSHALAKYFVLPQIRLNQKVSPHFSAEAGFATHFFGNGRRSLILADETYPYPYLKFQTDIWKLRYVNLFAWMKDAQSTNAQNWGDALYKFNAMHYLSWNVSPKLNISVFEAVVTPLYDSLMQRQFTEYNYMLPVVMYRPVDFALGSPDNVLVGVNVSLKVGKDHVIYSQLVLDEMFMGEIRADILNVIKPDTSRQSGAWVNKQALQLGWKYYDMFGVDNLDGLLEANVIRPYIYSHRDVQQNYTHLNQPLAHPHGANLMEATGRIRYTDNTWFFVFEFSALTTGLDSNATHFGQDIFKPSFDSPIEGLGNIPVQYYGNTIGQGVKTNMFFFSVRASRMLIESMNLRAEAGFSARKMTSEVQNKTMPVVHFAIKWGISSTVKGM